jgi:outer membrane protein OmpA-like peptidoglycan-associated protein
MSIRNLPGLVALVLLAVASPASAGFNSPTLLFDTPTADVLPAGSFAISADMTLPLTKTSANVDWMEVDANVRFSPVKRLDFAVTAFTLQDYVLDARYQLVGGGPERFGLAVGVYDVGIHNYVSPIGHDSGDTYAWPDWQYQRQHSWYSRPYENFSAFAVTSIPLGSFARLHLGLGRGRFVGYDGPNEYMNSDIFFNEEFHQWAVSLFGGLEVYVTPDVALVAEANSRDMNAGVKADFGPVAAAVAWTKMEGLVFAKEEKFGRLEFGATYKLGPWTRQPPPEAPTRPQELPPTPEPEPAPPIAEVLRLNPIWFMWDKWDITAIAAATLRANANVLLAHPDMRVLITGHASEEGSLEHNYPLSARRAYAAYEYLQSLDVPARQMRYRAMGESPGRPYPMHRSVYFEIRPRK